MALSVSIELVSSSARVTSVKSTQGVSLTDGHPDPKIGPQVYLGPIKTGVQIARESPQRRFSINKACSVTPKQPQHVTMALSCVFKLHSCCRRDPMCLPRTLKPLSVV